MSRLFRPHDECPVPIVLQPLRQLLCFVLTTQSFDLHVIVFVVSMPAGPDFRDCAVSMKVIGEFLRLWFFHETAHQDHPFRVWLPGNVDRLDVDLGGASTQHADSSGRLLREVDNPVYEKGTSIVDSHLYFPPVVTSAHPYNRTKWEGAVRGGERVHIVSFAVRRFTSVVGVSIPGSDAV